MLNKIKLGLVALLLPLLAFGQSYPSPTFNNLTVQGTFTATGKVSLASLATQAANTVVANVTASSASPTAVALPSCSTANSALKYTSATGFSCGTTYALTSGTLAQFAATTSAQLAGVISDGTGSGALVFGTAPTISNLNATGTPTAPTASAGTNTTQIATTAFVQSINSGRLIGVRQITSTQTYTATAGTNSVVVYAVGGGGGSGGNAATGAGQNAASGGGAAGGYAWVRITSGFSGLTATIGASGTAGAAGSNPGGTGGTTSLGSLISCPGGTGGNFGAAVSALSAGGSNGTGGAACTLSGVTTLLNTAGQNGMPGAIYGIGAFVQGGGGGSSLLGLAPPMNGTTTPIAGVGFGSGAAGMISLASAAAVAGAAGAPGVIIIFEFN